MKVRAVAHDGLKSEWSNVVTKVVDSTPPSPAPVMRVHSQPYQDYIEISWEGKARDSNKFLVELIDEVEIGKQIFEEIETTETTFRKELKSGRYTINVYSLDLVKNRSKPASYTFRIGMRLDIIRNQIKSFVDTKTTSPANPYSTKKYSCVSFKFTPNSCAVFSSTSL